MPLEDVAASWTTTADRLLALGEKVYALAVKAGRLADAAAKDPLRKYDSPEAIRASEATWACNRLSDYIAAMGRHVA